MKTILLADDDAVLRNELAWCLRFERHRVLQVSDGLEALRTLGTEPVDLVILDIHMPRMTGLEVVAQMKKRPVLARIPVLVLTGFPQDVPGDLALVTKPVHPETLAAMVRGMVGEGGRGNTPVP